jgi:hypothetical protein
MAEISSAEARTRAKAPISPTTNNHAAASSDV